MIYSNLVLPLQPCTASPSSCNWRHETQRPWAERRVICSNEKQQWDKKTICNISNMNKRESKKRNYYYYGKNHTSPLPQESTILDGVLHHIFLSRSPFSLEKSPFPQPQKLLWGGVEYILALPSLHYCKILTPSWPEAGHLVTDHSVL